jgi:hypothetical protein
MAKQAVRTVELATEDIHLREKAIKAAMKALAEISYDITPSYFGSKTHQIIQAITKNPDPYKELKEHSTVFAEKMIKKLKIQDIKTALRASLTANSIDYGADNIIDYRKTFEEMMTLKIARDESKRFLTKIKNAEKIVYFFDNAGEAVFDKKFIEFFDAEVLAVGKRSPMYNDVTASELRAMGFTNVLDCGDNVGVLKIGTSLEKELKSADLIISKGQANFESLPELWSNVFYLFKIKCRPMAEYLSLPIGNDIVVNL